VDGEFGQGVQARLKLPPSVAICPSDGGELTTDGQTLKCRHCSGESLLSEWNRTVARFVREAVRRFKRGAV